jgi:ribonuclease R
MPRRNNRGRARDHLTVKDRDDKNKKKPAADASGGRGTPRRSNQTRTQRKKEGRQARMELETHRPRPPSSSAPIDLIEGRVDLHPDGFGFLIPGRSDMPNVYLPEETLKDVMNRDEVRVKITQNFEDGKKLRGNVVDILRRAQREIIVIYRPHKGGALLIPSEARDRKHTFKLSEKTPPGPELKSGDALLCHIVEYPGRSAGILEILYKIEDVNSPSVDTLRVLLDAAWPREFTRAALSEAENASTRWKETLGPNVKDIRNIPLVTIDGRDARDFDDAVAAKMEGRDRIRMWVAIADVSHFVRTGTRLDAEAYERATSVYFPDFVVPMLPEVLSNGVCSLNPFEDRACMVAEMIINSKGEILEFEMYEGLMKSQRRLTYEQMQAFIDKDDWALSELLDLKDSLGSLVEVFGWLLAARNKRGAIDLEIPEAQVILNPKGEVLDIISRTRLDAHRLIEECMLAANQCAAKFLTEHLSDGMYRIHEEPDEKKILNLIEFLTLNGVNLPELRKKYKRTTKVEKLADYLSHPRDFSNLLADLRKEYPAETPFLKAIQPMMLRTLKQAKYATQPIGHFALSNNDYTHFTSPIRRYPDLIVHRLIKEILAISQFGPMTLDLGVQAQHCSDRERQAMDCERKLIDYKKCRFMEKRLGEEFGAYVGGITEKGAFCQIEGHYVDGLLSAEIIQKRLGARFQQEKMCYVGPQNFRLQLGDRLRVRLIAVDITTRRIDFDLAESDE